MPNGIHALRKNATKKIVKNPLSSGFWRGYSQ